MRDSPTVSAHFARALRRSGQAMEISMLPLLEAAGIGQQVLGAQRARIAPQQLAGLLLGLATAADDEMLGLASERYKFGLFGMMARLVVHCSSLREVLRQSCRFYNLVGNGITMSLEEEGQEASVRIKLADAGRDPDHLLIEYLLLTWHRFPSWLIGEAIALGNVNFRHATPAHVDEYRYLFPCPTGCGRAHNSLVFDRRWLDKPVVETQENLLRYLARVPQAWFIKQAYYPLYTHRVVECLQRAHAGHMPAINEVADTLHMSVRTLRRKLDGEGRKYQYIKDEIRRDAAIHYLNYSRLAVSEVGILLGYSEPAAFIRAFKQWTGLPPGVYRRESLGV